jgi:dihydropteroate synthase
MTQLFPRVLSGSTAARVRVAMGESKPIEGTPEELSRRHPAAESAIHNFFRSRYDLRLPCETLRLGEKTLIMGILNVTPDSFYDGGRYASSQAAVEQGIRMAQQGADIIDVGGESTRPGSQPVSSEEQIRRVGPVIRELAARGLRVSVDTTRAVVASAAIEAGAVIVNDTSGLQGDPAMIRTLARTGAAAVIMHIQGTPQTMQAAPRYDDVMEEVTQTLHAWAEAAVSGGVARDRIVVDPGFGFGKTFEHNLTLLARVSELRSLGFPVLVGASRKSFIGALTGKSDPEDRLHGSLAVAAYAAMQGAQIVRVHDVKETRDVLAVIDRVRAV